MKLYLTPQRAEAQANTMSRRGKRHVFTIEQVYDKSARCYGWRIVSNKRRY